MSGASRRDFLKEAAFAPLLFAGSRGGTRTGRREGGGPSSDLPSYVALHKSGELGLRARALKELYRNCSLCPRDCRVDRTRGQLGKCRGSATVKISNAFAHFGEEPPLVGTRGSGTIFFSNCGLRCLYCQNADISLEGHGREIPDERLAAVMLGLQGIGCHNINLVTPTHYLPGIVAALDLAAAGGLSIPLVYNTGGYEKAEIIRRLDGIVDIYMPDFKYWDPAEAARYSAEAFNYPHYAREAHREMHRQVGALRVDDNGLATRGLLIRHLVLPGRVAGTRDVFQFIARELSRDSYVNVMRQYRPEHEAPRYPAINRRITAAEFAEAMGWAREAGLRRFAR
ncbi:MAG: radical SAM protein [Candidatus Aminicenantes bacterium]|nr:radical SAM protein [Candidatus Aminicenantes bacterium]